MVDTSWMRQLNRRAPALQPANGYDPWAAWKQPDPYAPQTNQASPYTINNWGDVPGRTESDPGVRYGGPAEWYYARTATPDPHGNLPGTPGYTAPRLDPLNPGDPPHMPNTTGLNNGQARTGLPETGAPGLGGAPVVGTFNGAHVPAGKPAWSAQTAGFDGSGYGNIAKSFDPWGNWGQYGPNQARDPLVHMNGTRQESDIQRVYRWTNDILRQQGYSGGESAPRELRTQIFLANVERLKSEYAANKRDWNTSAFADMERGEQAMRGSTAAPGAAPGAPGGGNGQGSVPGAAGGGGIFPSEVEMQAARESPEYAIAAYRKARGGGQDKSAIGDFREGMMGQAVRAFLTMLGAGGPAGNPVGMANQGMGDIVNALASGTGVGGILRQQAQQMMGQDLSGFDDKQLLAMFGAAQGAGGFGLGPFAQYALDNSYGDMEHLAQQNALSGGTTAALANPAARQKFMADLARYLAVR